MTEHHVQHIKDYLKSQGFSDFELMDDLTDHLATEIEFSMDSEKLDFETSFENAKQKLLPDFPYQLERDLKILKKQKIYGCQFHPELSGDWGLSLFKRWINTATTPIDSSVQCDTNLCKRIIPCLDVRDGTVVKGINFINIKDLEI